jgi:hypothetical protein
LLSLSLERRDLGPLSITGVGRLVFVEDCKCQRGIGESVVLIHSKTHSLLQRIKVIIGNIIKCTDNRGWVRRLKESSGQRVEQLAPAVAQRPVNFIGNHPTGDLYGHKVALMKPMPNVSTRYHHYARDFGVEISTSIDHQDAGYDGPPFNSMLQRMMTVRLVLLTFLAQPEIGNGYDMLEHDLYFWRVISDIDCHMASFFAKVQLTALALVLLRPAKQQPQ